MKRTDIRCAGAHSRVPEELGKIFMQGDVNETYRYK